jgi:hypothetical protein
VRFSSADAACVMIVSANAIEGIEQIRMILCLR